jgi:formyltetrahydrofolate deformylase
MRVVVTAVGPNNWGLADPILHYITSVGATIGEIQMYDHPAEGVFALMLRCQWPGRSDTLDDLRARMAVIGREKGLSIRTWARNREARPPRIVLCTTYRPEPALAVLQAIRAGRLRASAVAIIGNRQACRPLAEEFNVPWHMIGDDRGVPDNERLVRIVDECQADYIVLARYMRVLPAWVCWRFAGGRIINLHHGLLPGFPGPQPYRDAFARHMLTYGATVHFIVPELDAGEQIIHQDAFAVAPGTPLEEIIHIGEREHEPRCLLEGLQRVVDGEVELHYGMVVRARTASRRGMMLPGPLEIGRALRRERNGSDRSGPAHSFQTTKET